MRRLRHSIEMMTRNGRAREIELAILLGLLLGLVLLAVGSLLSVL